MKRKTKKPQLVCSTSGIRGVVGNGLDPLLIVTYGAAFGSFLKKGTVVLGSDTRLSGKMVRDAVTSGLTSVGINVIDIGIVPTPTVEIAVKELKAAGGICVTASHNPSEWNALKFFNDKGEFITPVQYAKLDKIVKGGSFSFSPVDKLGQISYDNSWIEKHIKKTLSLKLLKKAAIKRRRFRVVVDAINGAGSFALPELLERMGVDVIRMNCKGNGDFVHVAEPTPKSLTSLARAVKRNKADLGMACDPDADRLALIDEKGRAISEEFTLTIAVLTVLKQMRGPTVINMSTSSATADVAKALGSKVYLSKVGEANVVEMMHKKKAVIGGEGNGGVILPSFHAGRDCLVAAALVLNALTAERATLSELVETFPMYYTIKSKARLPEGFATRLNRFEKEAHRLFGKMAIDRRDGLRFDFENGWLQLRSSNTEPIYRLIIETRNEKHTTELYRAVKKFFK